MDKITETKQTIATVNNIFPNNMINNKIDGKKIPIVTILKITALVTTLFLFVCLIFGGWKLFAPWLIEIATSRPLYNINALLRNKSNSISTANIGIRSKEITLNDILVYTNKTGYYSGEYVEHIIRNNSDFKRFISYPFYEIERFDEAQQKWIQVKIRYGCPCEAECDFANQLILQPKQFISNKWNQREEWCDGRQTVSNFVPLGKYRIIFNMTDGSNISGNKVFSDVFFIFETIEYKLNQQGDYISQSGDILNNFVVELSDVKMVSDAKAEFTVKNIRDLFIERVEFVINYDENSGSLENKKTLLLKENLVEDIQLPPFTEKKVYLYDNYSDLIEHFGKSFIITPVVQTVWLRK